MEDFGMEKIEIKFDQKSEETISVPRIHPFTSHLPSADCDQLAELLLLIYRSLI